MKHPRLFAAIALLASSVQAFAAWDNAGTTAGEFLKIVGSARSVSLGGGYAVLDDINNRSVNPAFIGKGEFISVGLNSIVFFQDIIYSSINADYHGAFGGVGVGIIYLDSGSIPVTSDSSASSSSITKRDFAISVGYGKDISTFFNIKWLKDLYVGADFRFFQESYGDLFSYQGGILDFGVYYITPLKGLSAGISLLNVKAFSTFEMNSPVTIKGGVQYDFSLSNLIKVKLNRIYEDFSALLDIEKADGMAPNIMLGLEARFMDMFKFRLGYKFLHDTGWISTGVGVNIYGIELSYSFSPYTDLGMDNQLSISYAFDSKMFEQPVTNVVAVPTNTNVPVKVVPVIPTNVLTAYMNPTCLSPLRKNTIDLFATLKGAALPVKWALSFTGSNGLVREITGKGMPPAKISWNGFDTGNKFASAGVYQYKFTVFYTNGAEPQTAEGKVNIDNQLPKVFIRTEKEMFSPDDDGYDDDIVFYPSAEDMTTIQNWKIVIQDEKKTVLREITGSNGLPETYSWDGRGNDGKIVPQLSTYSCVLYATDCAGNASDASTIVKLKTDFYLQKASNGQITINLEGVEFDTAKYTIRTNSYPILDRAALVLLRKSILNRKCRIEGHTDNQGGLNYNMTLSDNRSKAVMEYLISKGVDGTRLTFKGYGPTKPVAKNDTAAGRQKNRRVELILE